MTIHVGTKHQVTLPKEVVRQARLSPGDPLEVIYEDDAIILRPQVHVPRSQAYFWTKEWQAGEREADEAIRTDRVHGPFRTVQEMKRHFKKLGR
ncbi:MAG: AbrB/MazE/SpoVT family DNA-binding domain-containing protein [Candidatus Omnitrophica bacterium]|nr:AbrB/MazE/SpoVT family DNA-binding domain-containing protein [Candidatus Omnitrophota bacterium]